MREAKGIIVEYRCGGRRIFAVPYDHEVRSGRIWFRVNCRECGEHHDILLTEGEG